MSFFSTPLWGNISIILCLNMAMILWVFSLTRLRERVMSERSRFLWAVFITLIPIAASMAFFMVSPGYVEDDDSSEPVAGEQKEGVSDSKENRSAPPPAHGGAGDTRKTLSPVQWVMKHSMLYLSFFITAVVAVVVGEYLVERFNRYSESCGIEYPSPSTVEVLDYKFKPNGIYVKYRNAGDRPLNRAYFTIKLYDTNGLCDEDTGSSDDVVAPGETAETILKSVMLSAGDEGSSASTNRLFIRVVSRGGGIDE